MLSIKTQLAYSFWIKNFYLQEDGNDEDEDGDGEDDGGEEAEGNWVSHIISVGTF